MAIDRSGIVPGRYLTVQPMVASIKILGVTLEKGLSCSLGRSRALGKQSLYPLLVLEGWVGEKDLKQEFPD